MRHIVLVVSMVAAVAFMRVAAQDRDPLGVAAPSFSVPNTLQRCDIATAILRLAEQSRVLVGFERAVNLSGLPVRAALNHLITMAPNYRWSERNGVAVGMTLETTLGIGDHSGPDNREFRIVFRGGTIADALNELIRVHRAAMWAAGVRYHSAVPADDHNPTFAATVAAYGGRAANMGTPLFTLLARDSSRSLHP